MFIRTMVDMNRTNKEYVWLFKEYWLEDGLPYHYWEKPNNKIKPYARLYYCKQKR